MILICKRIVATRLSTMKIKGKAAFVARGARINDAGIITDRSTENESRLKRFFPASSAFKSIVSHYRSSVIDTSSRSTSHFFTRGHVAFIDYPHYYAKASKALLGRYFSHIIKPLSHSNTTSHFHFNASAETEVCRFHWRL